MIILTAGVLLSNLNSCCSMPKCTLRVVKSSIHIQGSLGGWGGRLGHMFLLISVIMVPKLSTTTQLWMTITKWGCRLDSLLKTCSLNPRGAIQRRPRPPPVMVPWIRGMMIRGHRSLLRALLRAMKTSRVFRRSAATWSAIQTHRLTLLSGLIRRNLDLVRRIIEIKSCILR